MDAYAILGVGRNATVEEIGRKFRERSKRLHPDAWIGLSPEETRRLEDEFNQLVEAKDMLLDGDRRKTADVWADLYALFDQQVLLWLDNTAGPNPLLGMLGAIRQKQYEKQHQLFVTDSRLNMMANANGRPVQIAGEIGENPFSGRMSSLAAATQKERGEIIVSLNQLEWMASQVLGLRWVVGAPQPRRLSASLLGGTI